MFDDSFEDILNKAQIPPGEGKYNLFSMTMHKGVLRTRDPGSGIPSADLYRLYPKQWVVKNKEYFGRHYQAVVDQARPSKESFIDILYREMKETLQSLKTQDDYKKALLLFEMSSRNWKMLDLIWASPMESTVKCEIVTGFLRDFKTNYRKINFNLASLYFECGSIKEALEKVLGPGSWQRELKWDYLMTPSYYTQHIDPTEGQVLTWSLENEDETMVEVRTKTLELTPDKIKTEKLLKYLVRKSTGDLYLHQEEIVEGIEEELFNLDWNNSLTLRYLLLLAKKGEDTSVEDMCLNVIKWEAPLEHIPVGLIPTLLEFNEDIIWPRSNQEERVNQLRKRLIDHGRGREKLAGIFR